MINEGFRSRNVLSYDFNENYNVHKQPYLCVLISQIETIPVSNISFFAPLSDFEE